MRRRNKLFVPLFALLGAWACGGRTGLLGDGFGESHAGAVSGARSGSSAGIGAAAGEVSGTMSTGGSITSAAGSSIVSTGASVTSAGGPTSGDIAASASGGSNTGPPSCRPAGAGMTNCRAGANEPESCCTCLNVEGGQYYRNYVSEQDGGPLNEDHPANISTFCLDKYDVTVGRFRQFVDAWNAGWLPPAGSGKHTHLNGGQGLTNVAADAGAMFEVGWSATDDINVAPTNENFASCSSFDSPNIVGTWTPSAGNQENLPINCATWAEAYAFCIWDGGFLPSEAEWEYAAVGGNEQREYPWGATDAGTNNLYSIYNCYFDGPGEGCPGGSTLKNIAPVGTAILGAGKWGQLDLVGELSQWALDWWAWSFVDPCNDCAALSPTDKPNGDNTYARVIRGGFFDSGNALPWIRGGDSVDDRNYNEGFRCARTPQ